MKDATLFWFYCSYWLDLFCFPHKPWEKTLKEDIYSAPVLFAIWSIKVGHLQLSSILNALFAWLRLVSLACGSFCMVVFVVNYIEIDPHHRHKYFTCWDHSLNWQNLCSLWHLNLSQNSRVYLTLFVWHLSLLTHKGFYLILVVAFEFANKSSIYFIQCHSCVVNSMRIKWGLDFHSITNFLDTWDEIISSSFMGAMNTFVVCMHHKILFGNLVFTYAYSQQFWTMFYFFPFF